jgi:hypothetical protein
VKGDGVGIATFESKAGNRVVVLGTEATTIQGDRKVDGQTVVPYPQKRCFAQVYRRAARLGAAWIKLAVTAGVNDGVAVGELTMEDVSCSLQLAKEDMRHAPSDEKEANLIAAERKEQAVYVRDALGRYLESIRCKPADGNSVAASNDSRVEALLGVAASFSGLAILLTRHWAGSIAATPQAADEFGRFAPVAVDRHEPDRALDVHVDFWMCQCFDAIDVLQAADAGSSTLCDSLSLRLMRLAAEVITCDDWWRTGVPLECGITPDSVRTGLEEAGACKFSRGIPVFDSDYRRGITGDHLDWLAAVIRRVLMRGCGVHLDQDDLALVVSLAPTSDEARIRRPVLGDATHLSEVQEDSSDGRSALAALVQVLMDADRAQDPSPLYHALAWQLLRACSSSTGSSYALSFCQDRMLERALEGAGVEYGLIMPVAQLDSDDPNPGWLFVEVAAETGAGEHDSFELSNEKCLSTDLVQRIMRPRPIVVKMLGSPLETLPSGFGHRVAIGELSMMRALSPRATKPLGSLFQWIFRGNDSDVALDVLNLQPTNRSPYFLGFDAWSARDRLQYFRVLEAWDPADARDKDKSPPTTHSRGFDVPKTYYQALGLNARTSLSVANESLVGNVLRDATAVMKDKNSASGLTSIAASVRGLICGN